MHMKGAVLLHHASPTECFCVIEYGYRACSHALAKAARLPYFEGHNMWRRDSMDTGSYANNPSSLSFASTLTPDWRIPPDRIRICARPDGSDWKLGVGAFGTVTGSFDCTACWK